MYGIDPEFYVCFTPAIDVLGAVLGDHFPMSSITNASISGVDAMDEIHVGEFIKWDFFENDGIRRTYGDDLDEILNSFDISGLACRKSK